MKVLTFGTFDLIHPGHIAYLKFAKEQGSYLYTIVATDLISERIKERQNIYKENKRLESIKNLKISDKVIIGSKDNPLGLVKDINPDIIVLGYDQRAPIKELIKIIPNLKIIRAPKFKPEIFKSSLIKQNAKLN